MERNNIQDSEKRYIATLESKLLKGKEFMYQKIGPGINISYKNQDNWYTKSYGEKDEKRGETTPQTLYDIASITKFITALQMLELASAGEIDLNDQLSKYLPCLKQISTTVQDALSHRGMFNIKQKYDSTRQYLPSELKTLFQNEENIELLTPQIYNYGDIGYMYLGEILSQIYNQNLDKVTASFVARNNLGDMMYNPVAKGFDIQNIARSEMKLLPGVVQDDKARWYGGVSGHSGLFASLESLQKLVDIVFNKSLPLSDGVYDSIFEAEHEQSPTTGMRFTGAGLRLGLFSKKPNISGFVGSSIFLQPEKKTAVVHTSNVTFPDRYINREKYRNWNKSIGDF
jgi:CubicO group peptidase (beta-lactamase class C family)